MPYCPSCQKHYDDGVFCPKDGTRLQAQAPHADGEPPDPMVGSLVAGRFRIVRCLGRGGMGTVYEAEHAFIQKRVALKLLKPEITTNPEAVTRFQREAMAASTIGHENIVLIDDFGRLNDNQVYLTMEFLEGEPLNRTLRRGPLPIPRILDIAVQVARGLNAAHQKGIVHRDMKPENIFLVDQGRKAKILDFGIAKVSSSGEATNLTKTGAIFGTPNYMAPEQALGKKVDHRADIYALGIMLYEMLAGRVPFQSDSFLAVPTQHVTEPPIPLSDVAPGRGIPQDLEAAVMRSIAKNPEDRFPDMPALLAVLESAQARFAAVAGAPTGSRVSQASAVVGAVPPTRPPMPVTGPGPVQATGPGPGPAWIPVAAPPVPVGEPSGKVTATAGELMQAQTRPRRRTGLWLGLLGLAVLLAGGTALGVIYLRGDPGAAGSAARPPVEPPQEPGHEPKPPVELAVTPDPAEAPREPAPPTEPKDQPAPRPRPQVEPSPRAGGKDQPTVAVEPKDDHTPPALPRDDHTPPTLPTDEPAQPNEYRVHLTSTPTGANILRGDKRVGRTPKTIVLKPGETAMVTFRRQGFFEEHRTIVAGESEALHIELKPVAGSEASGTTRAPAKGNDEASDHSASEDLIQQAPKKTKLKRVRKQGAQADDLMDPYGE